MKYILILLLFFSTNSSLYSELNSNNTLYLKGYDVVSYLNSQKAEKANSKFSFKYKNISFNFKNKINLNKFKQNPQKYIPAYGGYCAYAMYYGKQVDVNPKSFKIINDKTYLFYKKPFNNTLKSWNKLEKELGQSNLIFKTDNIWQDKIN